MIVEDHLGEGAFGLVFKGIIHGQLRNPKLSSKMKQTIGLPVAIKLLKGRASNNYCCPKDQASILQEQNSEWLWQKVGRMYISPCMIKVASPMSLCFAFSPDTASNKERKDFWMEIERMKKISEGHCNLVVNMVGCVTIKEPICLIMEFVPHGNLLKYLRNQRKKVTMDLEIQYSEVYCELPIYGPGKSVVSVRRSLGRVIVRVGLVGEVLLA